MLLAVIASALLLTATYTQRSFAGHLRSATNSLGEQYDPHDTSTSYTLDASNTTTTLVQTLNEPDLSALLGTCVDLNGNGNCTDDKVFGTVTEAKVLADSTHRTGHEHVGPLKSDIWQ